MVNLTLYPTKSVRVSYGSSDENFDGDELRAGVQSSTSIRYMTLMQFDLSAVPAGSLITLANLKLYSYSDACYRAAVTLLCQRLTASWAEETITYDDIIGDQTTSNQASHETSGSYDAWEIWSIINICRDWMSGTENNGVWFIQDGLTTSRGKCFKDKDDGAYSPVLELEYTAPTNCGQPSSLYLGDTPGASGDLVSEGDQTLSWAGASAGTINPINNYGIFRREYDSVGNGVGGWSWLDVVFTTNTYASLTVSPPVTRGNKYRYAVYTCGDAPGYDSSFAYSSNYLQKQPITACVAATTLYVNDTESDSNVNLIWSGADSGYGNAMEQTSIEYCESADGSSWGSWITLITVTDTDGQGSQAVAPPTTRGYYRKFRIRSLGAAGASYYSDYKESTNILRKPPYTPVTRPVSCLLDKSVAETQAMLSWSAGADGNDNVVSGYAVYKSDDSGNQWDLYTTVGGASTLSVGVVPRTPRGLVRLFGVVALGTATGVGSGDSSRRDSSNSLTKNRLPTTIIGAVMPDASVVIPGDTLRISFTVAGDLDLNLSCHQIGRFEDDVYVDVVGTSTNATQAYVDVDTTGWSNGKTYTFKARGIDTESVAGAWSEATIDVISGAVMTYKIDGVLATCIPMVKDDGVMKYLLPWTKHNGSLYKTK